jgi:hypothetical protein
MHDSSLRKAGALDPQVRAALEALLGRTLQGDESVSVRIYKSKPAPTAEARQAAYRELLDRASRIAEKVKEVPEAEIESAIDEATNLVRHTPE